MITITWTEAATSTSPVGGDTLSALPNALELDILEMETYDVVSTVTEHTVEEGAAITDHQIPQLDRVRFDVMVSDSPVSVAQGLLGTAFQAQKSGSVVLLSPDLSKAEIAFDTLHRLCREGIEVDIIGLRREIEGWIITSVTSDRRVDTAGALVASIAAQEVATAKLTEVSAPSPRVERVRPASNAGQQVTQTAGDSAVSTDPVYRDTGTQSLREDFYNTETGEPVL